MQLKRHKKYLFRCSLYNLKLRYGWVQNFDFEAELQRRDHEQEKSNLLRKVSILEDDIGLKGKELSGYKKEILSLRQNMEIKEEVGYL